MRDWGKRKRTEEKSEIKRPLPVGFSNDRDCSNEPPDLGGPAGWDGIGCFSFTYRRWKVDWSFVFPGVFVGHLARHVAARCEAWIAHMNAIQACWKWRCRDRGGVLGRRHSSSWCVGGKMHALVASVGSCDDNGQKFGLLAVRCRRSSNRREFTC